MRDTETEASKNRNNRIAQRVPRVKTSHQAVSQDSEKETKDTHPTANRNQTKKRLLQLSKSHVERVHPFLRRGPTFNKEYTTWHAH